MIRRLKIGDKFAYLGYSFSTLCSKVSSPEVGCLNVFQAAAGNIGGSTRQRYMPVGKRGRRRSNSPKRKWYERCILGQLAKELWNWTMKELESY